MSISVPKTKQIGTDCLELSNKNLRIFSTETQKKKKKKKKKKNKHFLANKAIYTIG